MRNLLFFSLVACGTPDATIDITHDACSGVSLVTHEPTATQTAGIDDAIALWTGRGVVLGRESGATIEVRFEEASGAFRGLYDDEDGIIYINRQLTEPSRLSIVIAHELGHAFGLVHVTEHTSLMTPGNLTTPPTEADQRAVEALWGVCDPARPE